MGDYKNIQMMMLKMQESLRLKTERIRQKKIRFLPLCNKTFGFSEAFKKTYLNKQTLIVGFFARNQFARSSTMTSACLS